MAGSIIVIFVILIVTFSWNAGVQKSANIGELTSLTVSQRNMTSIQEVTLDAQKKITATLTTYGETNKPQSRTGMLSANDKAMIVKTLEKYDLASLKSEIPPPDATGSHLIVQEGGNTHDLICVMSGSACSKLADELLSDFASILSRQQ